MNFYKIGTLCMNKYFMKKSENVFNKFNEKAIFLSASGSFISDQESWKSNQNILNLQENVYCRLQWLECVTANVFISCDSERIYWANQTCISFVLAWDFSPVLEGTKWRWESNLSTSSHLCTNKQHEVSSKWCRITKFNFAEAWMLSE